MLSDLFIYLVLLSVGCYLLMARIFRVAGDQDARDQHERIYQPGELRDDDPRDHPRQRG
ncbi:MAG: hypothetical protein ABWZ98_10115 [Nakamurella sp.]